MSWNLKGSYVETCSCDLMCPCNFSFDHGATYDYCRVTLVFNISEGEIEGTDVSGLKVAAIADTPKVMTEGNWRLGMFVDERATDEQMEKLTAVFGGQKGGPMEGLAPLIGEMLGVERAPIEVVERRPPPQRSHRRRDRLRDRGHRPVRHRDRAAGALRRHVPPGWRRTSRLARRRGRRSTPSASSTRGSRGCRPPSSRGPPERLIASAQERAPGTGGLAPAFAAARTRLGLIALLFALAAVGLVVDGRRDARHGRWAVDGAGDARLVRRRVGRDDGGDDVSVGGADGRALLEHDQEAVLRSHRFSSRPAISSRGRASECSPSRSRQPAD